MMINNALKKSLKTSGTNISSIIAVILILSLYLLFVVSNASNVPYYDDFGQQFLVINLLISGDWYSGLFRQHNEHRLFTTFIIPAFTWSLFGWVNMKATIFLGTLLNLVLFWFLNQLKGHQLLNVGSISIALILLAPAGSDTTWAGGTMQYYSVIFFGLFSIYCLTQRSNMFLLISLTSFFLASFSMISGLLACIPGILYLLILERGKPTHKSIVFTLFSCGIWFWYMYGYEKPPYHPSLMAVFDTPLFVLKYFLAFTGNVFADWLPVDQIVIGSAAIHLILAFVLFRYFRQFDFSDIRWFMLLYIFLAILSIVAGRSGFLSLEQALSDRYQIYSATYWSLILILLYKFNILSAKLKHFIAGFLLFLFITSSLKQWPAYTAHKRKLENGLFLLLSSDDPSQLQLQSPEHAKTYILEALEGGYYHPPSAVINRLQSMPKQKVNAIAPRISHPIANTIQEGNFAGYIDRIDPLVTQNTQGKQLVSINGWAALNAQKGVMCDSIFILVGTGTQQQFIANTTAEQRTDVGAFFKKPALNHSGFRSTLDITALQPPLRFGLLCTTNEKTIHCERIQKLLTTPPPTK